MAGVLVLKGVDPQAYSLGLVDKQLTAKLVGEDAAQILHTEMTQSGCEDVVTLPAKVQAVRPGSRVVVNVADDQYNAVPKHITSVDDWPKRLNVACRSCHEYFTGAPKFVPESFKGTSQGFDIAVMGATCSWACAQRHIIDKYSSNMQKMFNIQTYLKYSYCAMTGTAVEQIYPAPSVYEKTKYGGSMTTAEFNNCIMLAEKNTAASAITGLSQRTVVRPHVRPGPLPKLAAAPLPADPLSAASLPAASLPAVPLPSVPLLVVATEEPQQDFSALLDDLI